MLSIALLIAGPHLRLPLAQSTALRLGHRNWALDRWPVFTLHRLDAHCYLLILKNEIEAVEDSVQTR